MFSVNVGICFALNVGMNLIDLAIAQQQLNGVKRILTKVRILPGLWLILNSVLNVESQLRKIKDVII